MNEPLSHEQARRLAAARLDGTLSATEATALETHLAGCGPCRATLLGYESDRLALRGMASIEPPRDLWARTSAALEREHARNGPIGRRTPRRWGPVAVLGGGVAVVLAVAIVGPTLLGANLAGPVPGAVASSGIGGLASAVPRTTPVTVPTSRVTWVVTKGSQGASLVTADVRQVCPTGDEPDCAPLTGFARTLANLPSAPSSVVLSPTNGNQGVAVAPALNRVGSSLFLLAVPAAPGASLAPGPSPSPRASGSPAAASPTPTTTATVLPSSTRTPLPTPNQSPVQPSGSPSVSPPPPGTPAPSAAVVLAILNNVTLVGDQAAYSPDGAWFAFSARPAGSTTGPDIYVWKAGWAAALPITTDHGSVFSGWVAGQILASWANPIEIDGGASPGASAGPSASPAGSSGTTAVPTPRSPSPTPPSPSAAVAPAPAAGLASASPASSTGPLTLATPAAYLIDPASGVATRIVGLDGWRPVVDPSGTWVAFWAGTLALDPVGGGWQPVQGQLEIASWRAVRDAADNLTGAAAAHPLPLDGVADWDVRWDRTGQHLGVWIADPNNPGLGGLRLLTIDPQSGLPSTSTASLLPPTPALRGFALKDGQLVWATPPGQDGTGSHLSVLAWTGSNAGKTTVQSFGSETVIVVP